jgi:hypothetical protein
MIHGLSAIFACVDYDSITVGESLLFGDLFDGEKEMSQEGVICGFGISKFGDRLFGDDQDMNGGLWVYVVKGKTEIVFVDDIGRNFFANDFAENRIVRVAHNSRKNFGSLLILVGYRGDVKIVSTLLICNSLQS